MINLEQAKKLYEKVAKVPNPLFGGLSFKQTKDIGGFLAKTLKNIAVGTVEYIQTLEGLARMDATGQTLGSENRPLTASEKEQVKSHLANEAFKTALYTAPETGAAISATVTNVYKGLGKLKEMAFPDMYKNFVKINLAKPAYRGAGETPLAKLSRLEAEQGSKPLGYYGDIMRKKIYENERIGLPAKIVPQENVPSFSHRPELYTEPTTTPMIRTTGTAMKIPQEIERPLWSGRRPMPPPSTPPPKFSEPTVAGGEFPEPMTGKIIPEKVKFTSTEAKPGEQLGVKSFPKTVLESAKTTPELKRIVEEYEMRRPIIPNPNAINKADELIGKNPEAVKTMVMDVHQPPSALKGAATIRLIKHYEAQGNFSLADEVLKSYDAQLLGSGRYIQIASTWDKLSPETIIRQTENLIMKYKIKIQPEVKDALRKEIWKEMNEIQKMLDGPEKTMRMGALLNHIADKLPPKPGEIFDAFRYQNMLSNPLSHERNIEGNAFQMLITKPTQMIGEATYDLFRHPFNPIAREAKFLDVPRYYQTLFNSFPEAISAFKEAFRRGTISQKIMETGVSEDLIQSLRMQNMPMSVMAIPRVMEATDRFFSVLIGNGEKMRLMKMGMLEGEAITRGRALAEEYLYRTSLGKEGPTFSGFERALDAIGNLALQGRKLPIIGKPWSWFAPFVRTSTNIAKMNVRFSPFGFAGGSYSKGQIVSAGIGSMLTGTGAILALQDKTTWLPPSDPTARKLFDDSGRKPLSVEIAGKWIPIWYFGPFGLSLALPAMTKYMFAEDPRLANKDTIEKISNAAFGMARIITNQTPLSGVENFIRALSGDVDASVVSSLVFTGLQAFPMEGLVKYVNRWLDPIYRKSRTLTEAVKKNFPILSKSVEPIEGIGGKPSERQWFNNLIPYEIGIKNLSLDARYRKRMEILYRNAINKSKRKLGQPKPSGGLSLDRAKKLYQQKFGVKSLYEKR